MKNCICFTPFEGVLSSWLLNGINGIKLENSYLYAYCFHDTVWNFKFIDSAQKNCLKLWLLVHFIQWPHYFHKEIKSSITTQNVKLKLRSAMRRLLLCFLANILATQASFEWFDLYDSRTGELDKLDLIPNYKSVGGNFR